MAKKTTNRKWQQENARFQNLRGQAPELKALLRSKGCDLPFYDYLDSYGDEFQRIVTEAIGRYPSLVDVLEVEDAVYEQTDWDSLGFGNYKPIFFEVADVLGTYWPHDAMGNMRGHTTPFYDPEGRLRTVIIIRRSVKDFELNDWKYVIKIPTLLHELGHVHDIENGMSFDLQSKTANLVEAEAFANLYALDKLAERQLVKSYDMLAEYLRTSVGAEGWLGAMARKVIERLPEHRLIRVQEMLVSKEC